MVGSGCIGLRTAVEQLNNGTEVVLRSPRHFLRESECSQGAGGYWEPHHCDDERVSEWSLETLNELLPKGSDKENPTVEIMACVQLVNEIRAGPGSDLPGWTKDKRLKFRSLTVQRLHETNRFNLRLRIPSPSRENLEEAGYHHCWLYFSPVVDCPKMLQQIFEEIKTHPLAIDVDIETGHEYSSVDAMVKEAMSIRCDAIVNCTGMGSRKLCEDDQLVGGRGVLHPYKRSCARRVECVHQEGIDMLNDAVIISDDPPWAEKDGSVCTYMISRGNIIVVGGTYVEEDTEKKLRLKERERLLRNGALLGIDINNADPINEWVGFRPSRPSVRLEIDRGNALARAEAITITHNYGHGGSGWTVFVGAAICRLLDTTKYQSEQHSFSTNSDRII